MQQLAFRREVQLTSEEFNLLRDYIYEQTGIQFSDTKMYLLNNRLNKRLIETGCATYKDYYYYLKYDNSGNEFTHLLNVITTNETSFFRTDFQLEAFTSYILPTLVAKKKNTGSHRINIWSAGCSTGEEPYTLAILMMEMRLHQSYDIEIFANDISDRVLSTAREGIYNRLSLRNASEEIIQRYFNALPNNQFQIKSEVKRLIKFQFGNLSKPITLLLARDRDMIFCRNVMIYFGQDARIKTVKMFHDKLAQEGFLIIGHSETLHGISTAYKIVHHEKAIFYQKT